MSGYRLNTNSSDFFQIDGSSAITQSSTNITGGTSKGMGNDSISGLVDNSGHGLRNKEKYGSSLGSSRDVANVDIWRDATKSAIPSTSGDPNGFATYLVVHSSAIGDLVWVDSKNNPALSGYQTITSFPSAIYMTTNRGSIAVGAVTAPESLYEIGKASLTESNQEKDNYIIKRTVFKINGTTTNVFASGASDLGILILYSDGNKISRLRTWQATLTRTGMGNGVGGDKFNFYTKKFIPNYPDTNNLYSPYKSTFLRDNTVVSATKRGLINQLVINAGGTVPEQIITGAKTG